MKKHLKECGNLAEQMLDPKTPIYLKRVWGYESMICGDIFRKELHYLEEEDYPYLEVINTIKNQIKSLGWFDNKSVAEVIVGYHKVFIGFYDSIIMLGHGVIPNDYNPHFKEGLYGGIEKIKIR